MRSRVSILAALAFVLCALLGAVWFALRDTGTRPTNTASLDAASTGATRGPMPAPAAGDEARAPGGPARASVEGAAARDSLAAVDVERLVRGIVVDGRDRPIAGARVEARHSSAATYDYLAADEADAPALVSAGLTAADGTFALDVPPGEAHELRATAGGFAPAVEEAHAGEFVRIELGASARLEGTVRRAADKTPVAQAQVLLHADQDEALVTATDAGGQYRFEGLSQGAVMLQVIPVVEVLRSVEVRIAAGESKVVDVEVSPGATVSGVVRAFGTNVPIAGAEVSFLGWRGKIAVTDANGEYSLGGFWRAGPSRNVARAVEARARGFSQGAKLVAPPEGTEVRADIELFPAITAHGRIVDPGGAGVANAYVAIVAVEEGSEDLLEDTRTTRSREDGAFELSGLSGKKRLTLFARRAGLATCSYDLAPFAADAREVDLGDFLLPASGTIAGLVTDEAGAPIPGAIVQMFGTNASRTARTQAARPWFEGAVAIRGGESDARGRWAFRDVPAGTFRLRAYIEGLPPLENVSVTLAEGESKLDVRLALGGALAITGAVLDLDGAPLANATVTAEGELDPSAGAAGRTKRLAHARTSTDAHGRFRLAGLVAGRYTLTAVGHGLAAGDAGACAGPAVLARVEAGTADVLLQLPRSRRVEGRVTRGGEPHTPAFVVLVDRSGERLDRAVTDALGRFVVHVPLGTNAELRVHERGADGNHSDPIHIAAVPGEGPLEITLPPAPRAPPR